MDSKHEENVTTCRVCGETNVRATARFCDQCGAPTRDPPTVGEHKQVTVLFCDVVGSMALAAALGPERLREVMNDLFNLSAVVVQRFGGMVDKFTGDGLMALFGAPMALEDHASRACIAALQIQEVARELAVEVRNRDGVELRLRVGLNSGEVVAGDIGSRPGTYTAVGQTVGMAQRMESCAEAGTVLCSESTARLAGSAVGLAPAEFVSVKGEAEPVLARRLVSISAERPIIGRDEGPLLGRTAELNSLLAAFGTEKGCMVEIVGAPGLGKSRLIREFIARAGEHGADVVIARCDAHTVDVPLWALSRMLRAMFEIRGVGDREARIQVLERIPRALAENPDDVGILYELLGIAEEDAEPVEMNLDARRRRLVETMIKAVELRPRRTLFVLEDLHWIDAGSDATFAEFASTISATESMLVVSYRPEYSGALRNLSDTVVTLEPLDGRVTVEIVAGLLGTDPSMLGVAELIADAGAGNPFFVEEIVRDLAGRAVLVGSRGAYRLVGELHQITVPPTVQAVVAARIDRLSPKGKEALNAAAVIGNRFEFGWLQALLPGLARSELAELIAVELIDQIEFLPRTRYSFRHPLVRTVAYESQLSANRADAHRRLAEALETANASSPDETAALIGTHLAAAGDLARAYGWHMRAADWLQSRDIIAARSSWTHARTLADRLPSETESLPWLQTVPRAMLAWTEWLYGRDPDSQENYERLRELTSETGDARSQLIGIAGRMTALCTNYGRPMEAADLATELLAMIDLAETDSMSKVDLLFTVMWAQFLACDYPATLSTLDILRAEAGGAVNSSTARANAVSGVVRLVTGADPEQGRRDLALGLDQALQCDPATYAIVMSLQ